MKTAIVTSASLYVVIFSMAAAAYPGGTYFDHASVGHDFWRNTMCDVARTVALDGAENGMASSLAQVAMTSLAFGLGLLFCALPRLMPSHGRLGLAIRLAGIAAAAGSIAVAFLPTDRFSALHGLAIVLTGVPGFAAVLLSTYGLAREPRAPRLPLVLGGLALAVGGADFVLYVRELALGGAAQVAVAVLERLSTVIVLAWMVAVAWARRPAQVSLD